MAKLNGDAYLTFVDGTAFACSESATFTASANMIEVTNKDSNKNTEFIPGDKTTTLSMNGIVDFSSSMGAEQAWDRLDTGATVSWLFIGPSGSIQWAGTGLISDWEVTAPHNDKMTYSATIQVSGAVTKSTTP